MHLIKKVSSLLDWNDASTKQQKLLPECLLFFQLQLIDEGREVESLILKDGGCEEFQHCIAYGYCIAPTASQLPNIDQTALQQIVSSSTPLSTRSWERLLKLNLPEFDGSHCSWQEIWEKFNEVIHKNDEVCRISARTVFLPLQF